MKITKTHLKRIISEEIQNTKRKAYLTQQADDVNKICKLLNENKNDPTTLIVRNIFKHTAMNLEMSKYLRTSLVENLTADISDVQGVTDVVDIDVDEEISGNDVSDEEKSTRYHLWTLVQFGYPVAAAWRVIKAIFSGDFKGAVTNLPILNFWHVPEALYELLKDGLEMFPPDVRDDILSNSAVHALMKLLYSVKDVTTSEDISAFYTNLKQAVGNITPVAIAFCAILSSIASTCALSGAAVLTGILTVAAACETAAITLTAGVATPICAAILGAGIFIEACCLTLAGASGVLAIALAVGEKAGLGASREDLEEEFKSELMVWVGNLQSEHESKLSEYKEKAKQSEAEYEKLEKPADPMQSEEDINIDIHTPGEWGTAGGVQPMSEGLSYDRLQTLCGLDK